MKKNGFVTTGILFSLLILMVYLITSIVTFTVKIRYNKKVRVEEANRILDDDKSCSINEEDINCRQAIIDRVIYTKEELN